MIHPSYLLLNLSSKNNKIRFWQWFSFSSWCPIINEKEQAQPSWQLHWSAPFIFRASCFSDLFFRIHNSLKFRNSSTVLPEGWSFLTVHQMNSCPSYRLCHSSSNVWIFACSLSLFFSRSSVRLVRGLIDWWWVCFKNYSVPLLFMLSFLSLLEDANWQSFSSPHKFYTPPIVYRWI